MHQEITINDLCARISAYEAGLLDLDEEVELFQDLIDSNIIEHLQGSYNRRAHDLISAGLVGTI